MSRVSSAGCLVVAGLLLRAGASVAAAGPPAAALSVPQFGARLDTLAAAIEASGGEAATIDAIADDLPAAWRIEDEKRRFDMPTDWLRRDLRRWRTSRDPAVHARILRRLQSLRADAAAFQQPAADVAALRARAADILGGSEFRGVHGPTWVDRLRQRAYALINRLFAGVLDSSAFPTISSALVYLLIAAAGVTVVVWIIRFGRRPTQAAARLSAAAAPGPATDEWTTWRAEAESAATAGRWRDAIHFSYWCGVSFLESKGAWPVDRTRTPREYIRLLPPSGAERPVLAALTRRFERVWYGTETADADAFADMTNHLRQLGCVTASS